MGRRNINHGKPSPIPATSLRQLAEEKARQDESVELQAMTPDDARQLFHELRVHQIELEMQNEELRRTQHELEHSRSRYFDLYDLAPVGYLTLSGQGLIREANLIAGTMLGTARSNLLNKPISDFIYPEDQDIYYLHRKQIFETCELQCWEMRILRGDGSPFWARLQSTPALDGEYWITLVDISDRKRVETELIKANERFSLFMKHSPIYALIKDVTPAESRVLHVSDNYQQMIGLPAQEIIGRTMAELFPADLASKVTADDWTVVSSGEVQEFEEIFDDHSYTSIKFPIARGERNLIACYTIDTTEHMQTERVLQARLRISDYAFQHTLDELLTKVLDEAESLTDSAIGFFHFVDADQVTLTLQTWSSNTLSTICSAEGIGQHYPLGSAGVWADCIRERRALIHNDYESLPNRKGMPPGHAPVQRELVIPVFRNELIVAVLGVGNKQHDYTLRELGTLQDFANLAWDIITRKRSEDALNDSEIRFRSLMDLTPNIAVQGYSLDGTTTYWNHASELHYGYTCEEALGKNLLDLIIHPDMREDVRKAMQRIASSGEVMPAGELVLMRKDGTRVPVYSSHALLKPPGRAMELFCMDLDLTLLKKTEASLKFTESKFSRLFESMTDAYCCVAMDGHILESNEHFHTLTGYSAEEMPNLTYVQLTPAKWHALEADIIEQQVLARGFSDVYQKEYQRRDGSIIDVELKTFLLRDELGQPAGIWAIIRDITDRKHFEQELKQAKEAAETANRAKSDFLATMSHEIRTPLGAMLGNVELLEGSPLSTQQQEYLADCKSASQILLQVINDVLDYSKIEAGKLELVNDTFSIASMSRQLVRIFEATAHSKGLTLHLQLSADLPSYVICDQQRLRQILSNLFSNAIKFSHHGTVTLDVSSSPLPADQKEERVLLQLVVRDTGVGIPPDKQDQIFESFTQVENFSTRSATGTGLGLPICRRLLSLMGGHIRVESVFGQGSTFTVVLPVPVWRGAVQKVAPVVFPVQPQLPSRKILLADDDPRGRAVAQKLLQRKGYYVTAVEDGGKLLDTLAQEDFDILLTDISMPDMEGTQVARIIRSGERSGIDPHIPIIAMTAHAFSDDRERFLAAGINGYVSKPVNLEELLSQIELLCQKRGKK